MPEEAVRSKRPPSPGFQTPEEVAWLKWSRPPSTGPQTPEAVAWSKFRPLLNAHRDAKVSKGAEAADHEAWLTKAGLLVVRIHMLSVRGKSTGFDRAVYEGFNAALKRRGAAEPHRTGDRQD